MKKLFHILLTLCVLVGLVGAVSITAFAEETTTTLAAADVSVAMPVVGEEFPIPTVAENAGYTIKSYAWKEVDGATVRNASAPVEVKRYRIEMELEADAGYAFRVDGSWTVNGAPVDNDFYSDKAFVGGYTTKLTIRKSFSLRTPLNRLEITVGDPVDGTSAQQTPITCAEPDKYTARVRNVQVSGDKPSQNYKEGCRYELYIYVTAKAGYEYTEDCQLIVNGQPWSDKQHSWNSSFIIYDVDLNRTVEAVELPAFPETVTPGPGGEAELTVPEGANYTLVRGWIDMRTGELVQTLEAGDVYTISYVAVPNYGYFFREETVFTQNGAPCQAHGDETYAVVYKSYDLGAKKLDRVDLTVPQLNKGCPLGDAVAPENANYTLWESLWAESTTGSFADAQPVIAADYNTSLYLLGVLCAQKGYTFAADTKLYINGVEARVEAFYQEGPMLELAGLYGTLTPPTTDGWHREDNTWAYYVAGQKLCSQWRKDSIGWVYLDENGLMVKDGWAKDSVDWCYLGSDGYMVTNRWAKDSKGWCYLGANGYMVRSKWIRDSIDWCYVGADGYMSTNKWVADSKGWCFVGADGYMVRNMWAPDSKGICRLGSDGYMLKAQWVNDGSGWAYVDAKGYAVYEGWQRDSKGWCYIADYYMLKDMWFQLDGKVYYVDANGYRFANGSKQYNFNTYYTFDRNGVGTAHTGRI